MTERVMLGFSDRTGQLVGTLRVVRMVSRSPVRYLVKCERCGSSWEAPNTALQQGRACRNEICYKAQEAEWRR